MQLTTPLATDDVRALHVGDMVNLSGVIFTARDAAHARMLDELRLAHPLPVELKGQVLYFAGPTPAPPGFPIGSIGPTTSSRMDPYSPTLIEHGLKGMIGKGIRSFSVLQAMKAHGCVYFGAVEGTAALLAQCVLSAKVVAYEDLGTEAIHRLEVCNFPLIVVNDTHGGDLYRIGRERYTLKP